MLIVLDQERGGQLGLGMARISRIMAFDCSDRVSERYVRSIPPFSLKITDGIILTSTHFWGILYGW